MRAAWYDRFGAATEVLEIGDVETPTPGPGEVRVRVAASGVNPVDVKRRLGGRGALEAGRVIPHFDGAGTIDRIGDGVGDDRLGRRVWLFDAQWQRSSGSAAEYVTLPAGRTVPLPDAVTFPEGAALGIPALTAHRCVFGDGSVDGRTVLVTGGAGAVGRYAIQFAKLGGARVIATVSSPEKAESALAAGADEVINYRTEVVAARVRELTGGAGVDRIVEVELGGNLPATLEIIKTNGVVAAYASEADREPPLPFYRLLYKSVTLRHVLVFQVPEEAKSAAIRDVSRWLDAGVLSHQLGPSFPLDRIAAAHEAVEAGAVGKVIVEP